MPAAPTEFQDGLKKSDFSSVVTKTSEFQPPEISVICSLKPEPCVLEISGKGPQDSHSSYTGEIKSDMGTHSSVLTNRKDLIKYIHVQTKGRDDNSPTTTLRAPTLGICERYKQPLVTNAVWKLYEPTELIVPQTNKTPDSNQHENSPTIENKSGLFCGLIKRGLRFKNYAGEQCNRVKDFLCFLVQLSADLLIYSDSYDYMGGEQIDEENLYQLQEFPSQNDSPKPRFSKEWSSNCKQELSEPKQAVLGAEDTNPWGSFAAKCKKLTEATAGFDNREKIIKGLPENVYSLKHTDFVPKVEPKDVDAIAGVHEDSVAKLLKKPQEANNHAESLKKDFNTTSEKRGSEIHSHKEFPTKEWPLIDKEEYSEATTKASVEPLNNKPADCTSKREKLDPAIDASVYEDLKKGVKKSLKNKYSAEVDDFDPRFKAQGHVAGSSVHWNLTKKQFPEHVEAYKQPDKWKAMSENNRSKRVSEGSLDANVTAKKFLPVQTFPRPQNRSRRGGIAWNSNSCYFDSTIFAMFHEDDRLDPWFLPTNEYGDSKDTEALIIKRMLHTIVSSMRFGFCPSGNVERLRYYLSNFNPRMVRIMLDVEEMLLTLCKTGLKLEPFIKYTVGKVSSTNFYHQIFFQHDYKETRTVQELLETSMKFQRLIFTSIPYPAFFIKMPRNNGVLQHCRYILPNLEIDLSDLVKEGSSNNSMVLRAVICLQGLHYTVYVRNLVSKQWSYFNDLGPTIVELDNFEETLADQINGNEWFRRLDRNLENLMTGAHFCLYFPCGDTFERYLNR